MKKLLILFLGLLVSMDIFSMSIKVNNVYVPVDSKICPLDVIMNKSTFTVLVIQELSDKRGTCPNTGYEGKDASYNSHVLIDRDIICADPYVAGVEGRCICPPGIAPGPSGNSQAVETKYYSHSIWKPNIKIIGCQPDGSATDTYAKNYGDTCTAFKSCAYPFECSEDGAALFFSKDSSASGACICPGDSCYDGDTNSCVPCSLMPTCTQDLDCVKADLGACDPRTNRCIKYPTGPIPTPSQAALSCSQKSTGANILQCAVSPAGDDFCKKRWTSVYGTAGVESVRCHPGDDKDSTPYCWVDSKDGSSGYFLCNNGALGINKN